MADIDTVKKFEEFLTNIDIKKYREKYSNIKIVELDLDKNIQPLKLIYDTYWESRNHMNWLDYDDFYSKYAESLKKELEEFRTKKFFSEETFYRGIVARIYRHWASLLTQIQGAYVLESMFGAENVEMNENLDRKGTDILLHHNLGDLHLQVKKKTGRKDIRTSSITKKNGKQIVPMMYEVPPKDKYKVVNNVKILRIPYERWEKEYGKKLKLLPNGFVVFTENYFNLGRYIEKI